MKIKSIAICALIVGLASCGNDQPASSESEVSENLVEELDEDLSENNEEENYFTIESGVAGDFELGANMPTSYEDYEIIEELIIENTEEGPFEETVYTVLIDDNEVAQLKPNYDYESGTYGDEIGEIILTSDRFQTVKKIGVNSTITDFMNVYPDYEIWYTYISDMYVIESPGLEVQFLLDAEGFRGNMDVFDEMVTLTAEDFKANTRIIKVRMYEI